MGALFSFTPPPPPPPFPPLPQLLTAADRPKELIQRAQAALEECALQQVWEGGGGSTKGKGVCLVAGGRWEGALLWHQSQS